MPHYTTAFSSSDCTAEQRLKEEWKGEENKEKEKKREINQNLEQFDVDIAYSLTVSGPENGT